jgi:hypothetical protein
VTWPGSGRQSERGGQAARPEQDGTQDLALSSEQPEAGAKRGAREGARQKGEQGMVGCVPGRVWRLFGRNRKEGANTTRVADNRLPPTLGYRGMRVGEAKNQGPGEDLCVEILGYMGSEFQGGGGGGPESGPVGRSRTPPQKKR